MARSLQGLWSPWGSPFILLCTPLREAMSAEWPCIAGTAYARIARMARSSALSRIVRLDGLLPVLLVSSSRRSLDAASPRAVHADGHPLDIPVSRRSRVSNEVDGALSTVFDSDAVEAGEASAPSRSSECARRLSSRIAISTSSRARRRIESLSLCSTRETVIRARQLCPYWH